MSQVVDRTTERFWTAFVKEQLDEIAKVVLAYKPSAKTKKAKKRQRKRRKHVRKN